jgi:hypothetical protein
MPEATVLLIETAPEEVALERYTAAGAFAGDIWHKDAAAARAQAEFEFPGRISGWRDVPNDLDDPVAFALKDPVGGQVSRRP